MIKPEKPHCDTMIPPYLRRLRSARQGGHFDPLLGNSFGTSKRGLSRDKKNFDEIDNAGFRDYLHKRNFDEIDNAGFRDYLRKRNFDEIDNAGFTDYLSKKNVDDTYNAGFRDYLVKKNFDEIDNAGFRDYLYKKSYYEISNTESPDVSNSSDIGYRLLPPFGMPMEVWLAKNNKNSPSLNQKEGNKKISKSTRYFR